MTRQRSTAARKRVKRATRWGLYSMVSVLLAVVVAGAEAQMLAASESPDSVAAATASQGANVAGASNAAGASSSARTLYVYGDHIRPMVEETNGVQTLNIYGPGGQIIAQVVRDGSGEQEVRYLLADHLGSTRVALDADGNAVARFEYGPYGETAAAGTAAAEVRYRYTGHPWDEAQGVYETPARGYDPTLGRFLSVDPQRQGASPYAYAGNNPVGYVDPTGDIPYPFFIVSDYLASRYQRQMEGVLEKFGRPQQGTADGITTPSDLARIETHGDDLAALPNARRLLTGGAANIDRSRAFIFVTSRTTPDEVRSISEGMTRLKHLSREAGEPNGGLFEDITLIASHASSSTGQSLFDSLDASGFPRIRMFVQTFELIGPTPGNPNFDVHHVSINRPTVQRRGSVKWRMVNVSPQDYLEMMRLAPQPSAGYRNGYSIPQFRQLEPQLETRPAPQPQLQAQIDPVVPRVNEPVIPHVPD